MERYLSLSLFQLKTRNWRDLHFRCNRLVMHFINNMVIELMWVDFVLETFCFGMGSGNYFKLKEPELISSQTLFLEIIVFPD